MLSTCVYCQFFCICLNWSSDILLTPSREILLLLATLHWGQRSVSAADSIPRAARGLLSSVSDTSLREMLANTWARAPGTPVKIPQIATNPRKCVFFVYLFIWEISIFKYSELIWSEKQAHSHTSLSLVSKWINTTKFIYYLYKSSHQNTNTQAWF